MRPDRVVMAPPAFYDDLGLAQRVEYFAIEQFVAQACVKTLDVSVLPRAAWCDVGSLRTYRCQRRSKNASVCRSKNASAMLAKKPPNWGPFRQASSFGWIVCRCVQ